MQKTKISKTIISIALILMLTTVTFMVFSTAQATDYPSYMLVSANPNPVGVGQPVYINAFLSKPNQGAAMGTAGTRYEGLTIVITKPDGSKQTEGPKQADATGGIFMTFYPTTVGNYTVQAFYPGGNTSNTANYLPSQSEIVTFTAQQDQIQNPAQTPLPTEYWSRPIYSTNFEWGKQLGSNWWGLGGPSFSITGGFDAQGNVQPYGQAPNSAHILWTKPTSFGGQPGGAITSDQESQFTSTSILKNHFNPIILYGILYYQEYSTANNPSGIDQPLMWKAVDLRTGKLVWERNRGITGSEDLIWGQIQKFHTIQEYGSYAVLWSSGSGGMLYLYDAMTGNHMANVTNAPAAPMLSTRTGIVDTWDYLSLGSILRYYIDGSGSNANLTCWNSSKLFSSSVSGQVNWTRGIEWTFNIVKTYPAGTPSSIAAISVSNNATGDGVILMRSAPTFISYVSIGSQVTAGINLKNGALLWGPLNQTIPLYQDISVIATGEGVYILHNKDTNEAYGYSLSSGLQLWGPVKLTGNAFSYLSRGAEIAYGQVYIWDFGGYVTALDLQTGKINWVFTRGSAGYQTPYGIWPIWHFGSQSIGDGKLFLSEARMYDPPLSPGMQRLAINCTDGTLVWSILSFSGRAPGAIADGMMTQWNSYDKQIYTFGKGQTDITASIKNDVITEGKSILVNGFVIDKSPGTQQDTQKADFPQGVPAVSEASISHWMEYVYMQQPRPTNTTGVLVTLSVLDSNGNYREIGTTTSNADGFYSYEWTPDIAGQYTLYASFGGSESYWPSHTDTSFAVDAGATTPTPSPMPLQSIADMYFVPAVAGIIVVVAIVGAVLAILMLRKRP